MFWRSVVILQAQNICKALTYIFYFCFHKGVRAFIKRKETGIWCRGTITKLIPIKTKNKERTGGPMRCRVCDIAVIEIFLIDFGSSEVFNFSRYSGSCSSAMIVLWLLVLKRISVKKEILSQPILLAQAADWTCTWHWCSVRSCFPQKENGRLCK